jgi:hypothetical protein
MISWIFYPKSDRLPETLEVIVKAFEGNKDKINSSENDLESNGVLAEVRPALESAGFIVEAGKQRAKKISIPVLFGMNGRIEKSFEVDAYSEKGKVVLEVEAGRGVTNNQFLKDFFEACIMNEVDYLALAVRQIYKKGKNFEQVVKFFDSLYASNRLALPLKGILVIGY